MPIDRAIEILDPEHREHYDGLDEVNEACRMGMEALKRQRWIPCRERMPESDEVWQKYIVVYCHNYRDIWDDINVMSFVTVADYNSEQKVWSLNSGEMEICHKCDNPCCINPGHLFAGTRQDNVNDREMKGRNITFTGEEQPLAKLTKKAVKDARWERTYKGTSYEKLAEKYGVAKKTMQNAVTGVTWKCVPYFPGTAGERRKQKCG